MSLNTDLTGLFTVQKNYLSGIDSSNNDFSGNIVPLQNNLDKLYTSFQTANVSSSDVLAKQQEVAEMLNNEQDRLLQKQQNIDNALIGKHRAIALNDAYRLRQEQYTRIKIVIVIVLAICIFISLLARRFQIIPSMVVILLNIIIVLVGGIYCLFIYSSMTSRSKMNFNELDITGPPVLTTADIKANQAAAAKTGDLLGSINISGCIGSDCCSDKTKWDASIFKCVPIPAETTSSLVGTSSTTETTTPPAGTTTPPAGTTTPPAGTTTPPAETTTPPAGTTTPPAETTTLPAGTTIQPFSNMNQTYLHTPSEYDRYAKL
jgi:hypothetical protein